LPALGCALLAGLLWSVLGALIGLRKQPAEMVDLVLTGALVGVTVGAVGGTVLKAWRLPAARDDV
jgi:hypothetical protein